MHELGVTRSIVDIVVRKGIEQRAHRIVAVRLIVGKVRNFEQVWVQRYFDRCAKGTIAEGASVQIEYVPITFYCEGCGATFELELGNNRRLSCPECGSGEYRMITGGELLIKEIEVA